MWWSSSGRGPSGRSTRGGASTLDRFGPPARCKEGVVVRGSGRAVVLGDERRDVHPAAWARESSPSSSRRSC
jgi:hypothetical protein